VHKSARGISSTKDIIREMRKEKKKEFVAAVEWTLARYGEDELTAYKIAAPLMAADIDKALHKIRTRNLEKIRCEKKQKEKKEEAAAAASASTN
jgi:hypothetical protein